MIYIVPAANWHTALAEFIAVAKPGDTLTVDTEAKAELAKRAMDRMGKTGIHVAVKETS